MDDFGLDPLTGAYTRSSLSSRLEEEFAIAERMGTSVSILMIDLDYFKSINDAFGHATGDQVLQAVVRHIRSIVRKADLLFRYGGDEFILVLPNTSAPQAAVLARRLAKSISETPINEAPQPITISISGGTATYPVDGKTIETLFATADKRHYIAKRQGRARIITEDARPQSKRRSIAPPERLIGRDEALETTQHFLETLAKRRRSILQVLADEYLGQDDFLKQVRRLARFQGYLVLHIHASPALQMRAYGALREAQIAGISALPLEWESPAELEVWRDLATEKHAAGWVLLIEDWEYLDPLSRSLVEMLLSGREMSLPVGLVYTTKRLPVWRQAFPWNARPRHETSLSPLSLEQTQAWLRQALSWEPPATFIAQFHKVTKGKPGLFIPALQFLQSNEVLVPLDDNRWALQGEYTLHLAQAPLPPPSPRVVLPPIESTFIGHHQLIADLKKRLVKSRLISIIAPGGTGKTRLAMQLVAEAGARFPDGAFFVALDGIDAAEHIPEEIARTINQPLDSHLELKDAVCEALAHKHALLVLDNFEHLTGGEEYVRQLLQATEAVHILVTSRIPLNLPEEERVFLQGLGIPPLHYTPQSFDTTPAVQFFVTHLRKQSPDFQLTEENRPLIARVCKFSGGMPLALQMAAAWYSLMPLEELVERVERNLGMMVLQDHTPHKSPRQQTIRATFKTLWDILTEEEQNTLTRLAIFPSVFSADAARKITSISIFLLDGLVQRALLWRLPNQRYQSHPLWQQFLHEQVSPAILQDLKKAFIRYYAAFSKRLADHWMHVPRQTSQDAVALELDNLRQAWRWALESQDFAHVDEMLFLLHHYYEHNGWFQEAYTTFTNLLAFLDPTLHEESSSVHHRLYGHTLLMIGLYTYHLGLYDESLCSLQRSKAVLDVHGTKEDAWRLQESLGMLYRARGEYELGFASIQESKRLAEEIGNPPFLADSLSNLAILHYSTGKMYQAEKYFREALEIYRRENDEVRITAMLNNLGNVAYEHGNYEQARLYLISCLEMAEKSEGQTLLAAVLDSLGKVFIAMGDYEQAWAYLHRGLYICKKTNATPLAMELLINTGYLLTSLGDLETATLLWRFVVKHPNTPASQYERGKTALEKHGISLRRDEEALPSLDGLLHIIRTAMKERLTPANEAAENV